MGLAAMPPARASSAFRKSFFCMRAEAVIRKRSGLRRPRAFSPSRQAMALSGSCFARYTAAFRRRASSLFGSDFSDQVRLLHGAVRRPRGEVNLSQLYLGGKTRGVETDSLRKKGEGVTPVFFLELDHAEHVVAFGEAGGRLDGVLELQARPSVVSLFVEGLAFVEELELPRLRPAAGSGKQNEAEECGNF